MPYLSEAGSQNIKKNKNNQFFSYSHPLLCELPCYKISTSVVKVLCNTHAVIIRPLLFYKTFHLYFLTKIAYLEDQHYQFFSAVFLTLRNPDYICNFFHIKYRIFQSSSCPFFQSWFPVTLLSWDYFFESKFYPVSENLWKMTFTCN